MMKYVISVLSYNCVRKYMRRDSRDGALRQRLIIFRMIHRKLLSAAPAAYTQVQGAIQLLKRKKQRPKGRKREIKMKTIKNDMMELELSELEDYCGGDAFDVYADYLNTLFAKYGLRGIREVKKVCTSRGSGQDQGTVSPLPARGCCGLIRNICRAGRRGSSESA